MTVVDTTPTKWIESIGTWLGQHPASELDLVRLAEDGLPTEVVQSLAAHGLTAGEVSALVIPARTLKHRRSQMERLSKDESDKAIRSARILAHAQIIFGADSLALSWMRTAKHRFEGKTPMQMIETEAGGSWRRCSGPADPSARTVTVTASPWCGAGASPFRPPTSPGKSRS